MRGTFFLRRYFFCACRVAAVQDRGTCGHSNSKDMTGMATRGHGSESNVRFNGNYSAIMNVEYQELINVKLW